MPPMKRFIKFLFFILLILGIIGGIATWQSSWIQEKLGLSTINDRALAENAAGLALKDAELWLKGQTTKPVAVKKCDAPPCLVWEKAALPTNLSDPNNSWWQTQGRNYSKKIPAVYSQPKYVIEEHDFVPEELNPNELSKQQGYSYYRIMAKGTGKSENSHSILESIYSVKFN